MNPQSPQCNKRQGGMPAATLALCVVTLHLNHSTVRNNNCSGLQPQPSHHLHTTPCQYVNHMQQQQFQLLYAE